MAEPKAKTPKTNPKMWIGLLVVLVILIGGMSFMQMRKNKALQEQLDAKSTNKSGLDETKETNNMTMDPGDKELPDSGSMGDPK